MAADIPVPAAGDSAPQKGNKKVKLLALVVMVMGLEAIVIYFLLPKDGASAAASETDGFHGHDTEHPIPELHDSLTEVELGDFRCTNSAALPGSTVHVSCSIFVTVNAEQVEGFSSEIQGGHKARVRQAVLEVIRTANMDDLSDPELAVLKRLFKERVNRVLGKSYVGEVVVSDFTQIEQ